jgi:hypothetical protein
VARHDRGEEPRREPRVTRLDGGRQARARAGGLEPLRARRLESLRHEPGGQALARRDLDELRLELDALSMVLEDVPVAASELGRPVRQRLALDEHPHPAQAALRVREPREDVRRRRRDLDGMLVPVHHQVAV